LQDKTQKTIQITASFTEAENFFLNILFYKSFPFTIQTLSFFPLLLQIGFFTTANGTIHKNPLINWHYRTLSSLFTTMVPMK